MILPRDTHNSYNYQLTNWMPSKKDLEFCLTQFRQYPYSHNCVIKSNQLSTRQLRDKGLKRKKKKFPIYYAVFIKVEQRSYYQKSFV